MNLLMLPYSVESQFQLRGVGGVMTGFQSVYGGWMVKLQEMIVIMSGV